MFTGTGDENTDIGAHLLGFVCGFGTGMLLTMIGKMPAPPRTQTCRRRHGAGVIAISPGLSRCRSERPAYSCRIPPGDSDRLQQPTMKKILLFLLLLALIGTMVLWVRYGGGQPYPDLSTAPVLNSSSLEEVVELCRNRSVMSPSIATDEFSLRSIQSRDRRATSYSSMCAVQRPLPVRRRTGRAV